MVWDPSDETFGGSAELGKHVEDGQGTGMGGHGRENRELTVQSNGTDMDKKPHCEQVLVLHSNWDKYCMVHFFIFI